VLKLILDQDFHAPVPAVDQSPFSNHGRVIHATFAPDGRGAATGALGFQHADSAVRIALTPVWQKLTALCIEAWIHVTATGTRRNIIEGDGSFAFFLNPDDTLVGSVFSLVDGAATPAWNTASSGANSPDGVVHRVPLNRWCKVVFHHDGITRARLFLDDRLIGVRGDYRSGLAAVAGAGVVIGNWTLANQFAFAGSIDRVRVWKRDEYAAIRNFTARPVDAAARDAWDDVWACLATELNVDNRIRLQRLGGDWEQLLRELFRAVHAASDDDRERFRRLIEAYRKHWRANTIGSAEYARAVGALRDWIARVLGPGWAARADELVDVIGQIYPGGRRCLDLGRITSLDPQLARLIANLNA
jgi:hypothetical protein